GGNAAGGGSGDLSRGAIGSRGGERLLGHVLPELARREERGHPGERRRQVGSRCCEGGRADPCTKQRRKAEEPEPLLAPLALELLHDAGSRRAWSDVRAVVLSREGTGQLVQRILVHGRPSCSR